MSVDGYMSAESAEGSVARADGHEPARRLVDRRGGCRAVAENMVEILVDVTLTVRARTKCSRSSCSWSARTVWWLPRGNYGCSPLRCRRLRAPQPIGPCVCLRPGDLGHDQERRNGSVRNHDARRRNGAELHAGVDPAGCSREGRKSSFEIRTGADKPLFATSELVTFESQPSSMAHPACSWSACSSASRCPTGWSRRTRWAAHAPADNDRRRRAHVRARVLVRRTLSNQRRALRSGRRRADSSRRRWQGLLLGLLSLDSAAQREFDVTLHTELAEVFVRRLGGRAHGSVYRCGPSCRSCRYGSRSGSYGCPDRRRQLLLRSSR